MRTRSTTKIFNKDNKYTNNKFDEFIIEIETKKVNENGGGENFLKRKRNAGNCDIYFNGGKKSMNKNSNNDRENVKLSPQKIKIANNDFNKFDSFDLHNISVNLDNPKMISEVFNESFVDSLMHWRHENPPGSGLKNIGNTCFLNSVLQCVLYTVPLKNYLNYSEHCQMCKIKGVCFICEFGRLSKLVELKKSAIIPQNIIQNIRNIGHHIKIGRQEDAHEFLLYFLAAMENSATNYLHSISKKFSKLMKNSFTVYFEENNLIQKIFGGTLISSVTCGKCKNSSTKSDKFIDISLEIAGCNNISECFKHFCKAENLTGNNKYFCDNCNERNDSVKKLTFEKFPRILVVHLKRFDNKQRKIRNFIQYDKEIDLNNFSLNTNLEKVSYRLNSILVHEGSSIYSGHYYSYVQVSDNNWYCFNDSNVRKVEESKVLKQTPYILFYEKIINRSRIGMVKFKTVEKVAQKEDIIQQKRKIGVNNCHKKEMIRRSENKKGNTRINSTGKINKKILLSIVNKNILNIKSDVKNDINSTFNLIKKRNCITHKDKKVLLSSTRNNLDSLDHNKI